MLPSELAHKTQWQRRHQMFVSTCMQPAASSSSTPKVMNDVKLFMGVDASCSSALGRGKSKFHHVHVFQDIFN